MLVINYTITIFQFFLSDKIPNLFGVAMCPAGKIISQPLLYLPSFPQNKT